MPSSFIPPIILPRIHFHRLIHVVISNIQINTSLKWFIYFKDETTEKKSKVRTTTIRIYRKKIKVNNLNSVHSSPLLNNGSETPTSTTFYIKRPPSSCKEGVFRIGPPPEEVYVKQESLDLPQPTRTEKTYYKRHTRSPVLTLSNILQEVEKSSKGK